jgi:anti-anti-sigma regulatory factor
MVSFTCPAQAEAATPPSFETLRAANVLYVTPQPGCGSLPDRDFTLAVNGALKELDLGVKIVIVDLSNLTSCSSDRLLGPLVVFWNRIRKQHGRMAICGLYKYGREVLRRTRLDLLWPVCDTREAAVDAVNRTKLPADCENLKATLDWIALPGF